MARKRALVAQDRVPSRQKISTERTVERALREVCNGSGWLIYKNHPLTHRGIPDRIIHPKGLSTFYVELKATGEKCTEEQIEFHKRLKALDVETYVLDVKIYSVWDIFTFGYTTYEGKHFHKNPFKN